MNAKQQAVTDADGRPPSFLMTADQVSNHTGAARCSTICPRRMGWIACHGPFDRDKRAPISNWLGLTEPVLPQCRAKIGARLSTREAVGKFSLYGPDQKGAILRKFL